jgi:hypothetical protein
MLLEGSSFQSILSRFPTGICYIFIQFRAQVVVAHVVDTVVSGQPIPQFVAKDGQQYRDPGRQREIAHGNVIVGHLQKMRETPSCSIREKKESYLKTMGAKQK